MNNEILKVIQQSYVGKDLSDILKMISAHVWDRIGFARNRKRLKIYETTISQDILHFMALAATTTGQGIRLHESRDEKANGNDMECYIQVEEGYVLFPVQAKLMYHNHKYVQIAHSVNGVDQIDLLINYARQTNGFPLFFLYNYHPGLEALKATDHSNNHSPDLYGVSFVSAFDIEKRFRRKLKNNPQKRVWSIPRFQDLHFGSAQPFHELVEMSRYTSRLEHITNRYRWPNQGYPLKLIPLSELMEDERWVEVTLDDAIETEYAEYKEEEKWRVDNVDSFDDVAYEKDILQVDTGFVSNRKEPIERFNPKFRMVISARDK